MDISLLQFPRMTDQPLKPGKLIVELRPRLRIAVRRVNAANDYPVDRGLDIAALAVAIIAQ